MSFVLVVDTNKQPCSPVHPGEARRLLTQGKAAVFRRFPFTIILKYARPAEPPTLRLKIASARKQTGIALVDDAQARVVWGAEITHQVEPIHQRMLSRASLRRSRRQRKTRYRPPRFLNRPKPKGWLAPSLSSRVANIMTWVQRLCRLAPVGAISYAPKKFDSSKPIDNY